MKVLRQSASLKRLVRSFRKKGQTLGFVPTMGCLHEGHLSLVRRAKRENDRVAVSIFVNPLQFGPKEDLSRYPRDLARDTRLLKAEKVDLLFVPSAEGLYPKDFQTQVCVKEVSKPLCGATRPTHFAGVATVVLKLVHLVSPDTMYLGQKDHQQFRVIEQMVRDLAVPVTLKMCPIVREKDGLAMSSRNRFLDTQERMQATQLNKALAQGESLIRKGVRSASKVKEAMRAELAKAGRGKLDYLEIVDSRSLSPMIQLKTGQKVQLALAVFFSKARLIDNRLIRVP
jgi:pantoate--beta-alanine ligase